LREDADRFALLENEGAACCCPWWERRTKHLPCCAAVARRGRYTQLQKPNISDSLVYTQQIGDISNIS